MSRLLGIDIGTTGCKAVLVDESGRVINQATANYTMNTPQPGWTEQNPEDWWIAVQKVLSSIGRDVDAIGLTGQMHGSVFLDERGEVIRPALLWNDQRTANQVDQIERVVGLQRIYRTTCNPPLTGFQAPKILWLRENEPDNYRKTHTVLLPKDYIRLKLCKEKATDVSDAAGTGLFDVPKRKWAEDLIEALQLNPRLFPPSYESYVVTGKTSQGIPVIAGAGDQAAGAVGTGAVTPEITSISLGTSGVVFVSQDAPVYDPKGRVHTFCHANAAWHSMGVMLSCGAALEWVRDNFHFSTYDEMAQLAKTANPKSKVIFKPYLAGERTPHNNPNLRAHFAGLSLADGRAETARATFEGIIFALLDGFQILQELVGSRPNILRVTGGGARSSYWLQLIADAFGLPAARVGVDEGPAFGAAVLAGVGLGVWQDVRSAAKHVVRVEQPVLPGSSQDDVLRRHANWLAISPPEIQFIS